jgi:hypothetical protein
MESFLSPYGLSPITYGQFLTNPAEEDGYNSCVDDFAGHAPQYKLAKPGASVGGHGDQIKTAIFGVVDNFQGIVAVADYGIYLDSDASQVSLHFSEVFFGFADNVHLMLDGIHSGKGMCQCHPQKGNLAIMGFGQPFHSGQNSFGQLGAIQGN